MIFKIIFYKKPVYHFSILYILSIILPFRR